MALLASAVVLAVAGAVQWQAPAACPSAAEVEGRVHALLGRVPAEHELQAAGVVSGGPPWRLELETTIGGRRQRRTLAADDCRAVAEAAALVLAVSVDPLGASGEVDEGEATRAPAHGSEGVERPRQAVAVGEPVGADASGAARASAAGGTGTDIERTAAAAPRPSLGLRVGGGAETLAIPGGTGGVRLGLALEGERGLVRLEGSYWLDRLAVLRDAPARSGARVGLGTVTLAAGPWLGGERVRVPLTLGLEAGGLRTRAVGLARGRDVVLPWVAAVVGVGLAWSASPRVALWAAAEGVLPLVRLRVRVGRNGADEVGEVVLHEPAVVGVRALAGLSIKIAGGS